MNKKTKSRFIRICKMTEKELKSYLQKEMEKYYDTVINEDGFLYCKGNYPVLLTAHMDTVHKEPVSSVKVEEAIDSKGNIYHILSSPQGIGGDDRCGIYMILSILRKRSKNNLPSVLFCEQEEIGGVGSWKFVDSKYIDDLKEMKFLIELDRANADDAVFYDDINMKFHNFVEDNTYLRENYGSFSDICNLSPACGVASVNISCGYYKAHTLQEEVIFEDMEDSIREVEKLIDLAETCDQFEYKESKYKGFNRYYNYSYNYNYDYDDYDYIYNSYTDFRLSKKEKKEDKKFFYVSFIRDGVEQEATTSGETEEKCWRDFFITHPDVCFNDVLDFYFYTV